MLGVGVFVDNFPAQHFFQRAEFLHKGAEDWNAQRPAFFSSKFVHFWLSGAHGGNVGGKVFVPALAIVLRKS